MRKRSNFITDNIDIYFDGSDDSNEKTTKYINLFLKETRII